MSRTGGSRTGIPAILACLVAIAVGWQWYVARPESLVFTPIADLEGWQRLEFDGITRPRGTATSAALVGIGAEEVAKLAPEDLCDLLYPNSGEGIPVAVFTDAFCPNCQSLEAKLAARDNRLNLTWIDLPIRGPRSESTARIAVAAALFGDVPEGSRGSTQFRGFADLVRHHAGRAGLDPEVLRDAMASPEVDRILDANAAAAETLGVWGTPAMTIGKTLVLGDLPSETLDQLLSMPHAACG